MGVKVRKYVHQQGANNSWTDYLNGFQYSNEILQFFPHAEGYVQYYQEGEENGNTNQGNDGAPLQEGFSYVYQFKDHLGNNRINYTLNKEGTLSILSEDHYYPFGMKHPYNSDKREWAFIRIEDIPTPFVRQVPNSGYQYKYNGKEWQDELGLDMYDFGFRNYEPSIGRWMNVDPLAEKYTNLSPYTYVTNNPVYFIDPDGRQINILNSKNINDKEALELFKTIINQALGGNHEVIIDKNGKVSLKATGKNNELTDEQKGFYSAFNEVVESEHNVDLTVKNNQGGVYVGSFENGVLDVGDMMQFDKQKGGYSSASNMIHEVVEQHEKAKNRLSHAETDLINNPVHREIYRNAHNVANSLEQAIFGYSVIEENRQGLDMTFRERDGSTTRQVVELQEKMKDGRLKPLNPRKPIKVTKTKGK